jgi:hypothetical protein
MMFERCQCEFTAAGPAPRDDRPAGPRLQCHAFNRKGRIAAPEQLCPDGVKQCAFQLGTPPSRFHEQLFRFVAIHDHFKIHLCILVDEKNKMH